MPSRMLSEMAPGLGCGSRMEPARPAMREVHQIQHPKIANQRRHDQRARDEGVGYLDNPMPPEHHQVILGYTHFFTEDFLIVLPQ